MMFTISKLFESISCLAAATAEAQARSRIVAPAFYSRYE